MEASNKLMNNVSQETSKPGFSLMKKSDIQKEIKAIGEAFDNLEARFHTCLCQCVAHSEAHGDVSLVEMLMDATPQGRWNNGVKQWLTRNSPIRVRPDGTMHQLKKGDDGFRPYNLEAAVSEDPIPKDRQKGNSKERTFSLLDINKIPEMYRKRLLRAKEDGSLIKGDEKKITQTLQAFETAINTLDLKPTKVKVVEAESETEERIEKPKITLKKQVQVKPRPKVETPSASKTANAA